MQQFSRRQRGEVFGDMDTGVTKFKKFDLFFLLSCAEDYAQRRLFAGLLLVACEPTEVEFHLAFVLGLEVAKFEINGNEALQIPVIEEEVEIEIIGIDLDSLLAGEESEAVAEFQEESFDFPQDGVFKVLFEVAVVEVEEVEDVGIPENHVRGNPVLGAKRSYFGFCNFFGLFRYRGAFKEH